MSHHSESDAKMNETSNAAGGASNVSEPNGAAPTPGTSGGEVGRLQALLESRGLFGALRPRVHHLLHRNTASGSVSKAQQLIQGLTSIDDEGQQLSSVIELCQMLVMGNEETLVGFPVKQAVPALIALLHTDGNFDMMHHACRALTYMMEALPRSSDIVVDAVPALLDKLKTIECMDVAEQSLQALEILSRKHSKIILRANGISTCLAFLEFFSMSAQRAALTVVANCCHDVVNGDDFRCVRDSLSMLVGRLTQQDQKSVEQVCLCLARLVDNFYTDERILKEIAAYGLLTNLQQLLVVTPPLISTSVFVTVVHMLVTMCVYCSDLAVVLLKLNISDTLCFLLIGPSGQSAKQSVELVPRTPHELYEIVSLIGELLPKLPTDGIFAVDSYLRKGLTPCRGEAVTWQWKDERGHWRPYSMVDCRIIEMALQSGEREVSLSSRGRAYTIDFTAMQQIDDDTGSPSKVLRQETDTSSGSRSSGSAVTCHMSLMAKTDSRADVLAENAQLADNFIKSLFTVLYEVYGSSAGPSVRYRCLQAMLRMMYYGTAELLQAVLSTIPISSHIAAMMASSDLNVVIASLQMAFILMEKLPNIYSIHFRREGVIHQISRLSVQDAVLDLSLKKDAASSSFSSTACGRRSDPGSGGPLPSCSGLSVPVPDIPDKPSSPLPHLRLSDVLKRKKPPKRPVPKAGSSHASYDDSSLDLLSAGGSIASSGSLGGSSSLVPGPSTSGASSRSAPTIRSRFFGSKDSSKTCSTPKMSLLASLNPSRWARSSSDRFKDAASSSKSQSASASSARHSHHLVDNREKVKQWIREQAMKFSEKYFGAETNVDSIPALGILNRLSHATSCLGFESHVVDISCLQEISAIISAGDVSSFEIIHSGLINKLIAYLTSATFERDLRSQRDDRLRTFLNVFAGCPETDVAKLWQQLRPEPLATLVSKLVSCFHHLEQFQVKVHDLVGGMDSSLGRGSSNAMKFFSTHQVKCELRRHPSCSSVRQWKGGLVRIDPLALIQTVERFLLMRGYGRTFPNGDADVSDDDDDAGDYSDSDYDIDNTLAAVSISQGVSRHHLELLIGSHILPYSMTVYQAVKQYSPAGLNERDATETDYERSFDDSAVWLGTHTIFFRAVRNDDPPLESSVPSPKKTKSIKTHVHSRVCAKRDESLASGVSHSALECCLSVSLPMNVTVKDPAIEVLALLRILHGLSVHWNCLYHATDSSSQCPLLPSEDFQSSKLTAKANRQLLDPLVIMTSNIPVWLTEIGYTCPFLFPFDTRLLLFYATSLDRDRALQHLQDMAHDSGAGAAPPSVPDSLHRAITPRLERRKVVICRDELLKQAEKLLDDLGWSKAVLEIQYEHEVGTGLGPTLEFYALVSREFQNADRAMWRGETVRLSDLQGDSDGSLYVHSPCGLFPSPIAKHIKPSSVFRIKSKFQFLGKFLAKALVDSRMLDLPLSQAFYKWLLGQEATFTVADLRHVDSVVARSVLQLHDVVVQKKRIEADPAHTAESRQLMLDCLTIDGCTVEDLELDFVLPGYPDIELKKGGKDISVTLDNLEEYIELVVNWTLVEGVRRQFDAVREGFEQIFPLSSLSLFYPEELDELFCGCAGEAWDVRYLMQTCRPDHGYTHDSQPVRFLYEILSSYNCEEQRTFLRFVTGSPRLPVGGLRSLVPPLTVVRKSAEGSESTDDFLPSVMTCVNYLKLPDYSTIEVMRHKLNIAIREGQLAFHLS